MLQFAADFSSGASIIMLLAAAAESKFGEAEKCTRTRVGPNRLAAARHGGNGEFDFLVIYEDFWIIFEVL